MNLTEMRAMMLGRLNRDDCDDATADGFLTEGTTRIQREVRAPFQERVFYVDAAETAVATMVLPADYIEGIDVLVDGKPLDRLTYRVLMRKHETCARYYSRFSGTLYFRGACPPGSRVELLYYAAFAALDTDESTNALLTTAPDLLLYAALSVAGDHFQHEKTSEWEARYVSVRDALMNQAVEDEMRGGPQAIQPLYFDPGAD